MEIDRRIKYRTLFKQFMLFGIIGLLNTALDFMVYWLLTSFAMYYILAQLVSYITGMLSSYILNSIITFKGSKLVTKKAQLSRGIRFLVWNGSMLLLSILLLYIFKERLHLTSLQAKFIATIVIVIINFIGSKRWVFRDKRQTMFDN